MKCKIENVSTIRDSVVGGTMQMRESLGNKGRCI